MRNRLKRAYPLFSMKDENGRGRVTMLLSAILVSVNNWLAGGLFYTSFLMIYGIDLVNISIVIFVPYIAGCFGIFAPSILERFKKRRWVLAAGRFLFYTLNILGITLVPVLVADPAARITALIAIIFLANLLNALTASGYSAWHVNFIPPNIRADFFSVNTLVSSFIGVGASLISALVADSLANSPYQDTIIIAFRYIAYALALVDVGLLLTPKEYPYARSEDRPRFRNIFMLPLRHKPFLLTMTVIFLYTFSVNIPASSLNYYLINNVGAKYSFIYAVNMIYPLTLLFLLPAARRILAKLGWFKTFAIFLLLVASTDFMYAFVTSKNYLWLFPLVRILQHVYGTAANLANANLVYANLPDSDRTNYISFYMLTANVAAFLGMLTGTVFISLNGASALTLFGFEFTSVQMLLWLQAIGEVVVPIFIFANLKTLTRSERRAAA